MGIYDRDYNRGYRGPSGFDFGGTTTLTTKLVVFMVVVYLVQLATRGQPPDDGKFTDIFSLHADVFRRPWLIFEFLTYGFLHDPWSIRHILFNMVTLWFLGRFVENRYGPREYLAFFLCAIVFAGLTWAFGQLVASRQLLPTMMLGASGGIMAVTLLFCLNFPHEVILIMDVIPIPAWLLGIVYVGQDLFGAMGRHTQGDTNVAFTAHLGGALFALVYFQAGWRLERLLPTNFSLASLKPKPRLRVVDPDSPEPSMEERVDEILKKIQEQGRDSLTREERRILEEASQKFQRRRR